MKANTVGSAQGKPTLSVPSDWEKAAIDFINDEITDKLVEIF